jgi:hypothetical protein
MLISHPFFCLHLSNINVSESQIVSTSWVLSQHYLLLVQGNRRQELMECLSIITFITFTEEWKRKVGRIRSCHLVAVFWRCYSSTKIVRKMIPNHDTCYGPKNTYKQHQQFMLCNSNLRSDVQNSTYVYSLYDQSNHSEKCSSLETAL